jgi:NADH-quinone oxidoreductase subunit M
MSLAGFGLTLRSVEARIGRVLLTEYHGLFDQMPTLAGLFLLTGLSSIGFPGTVGFIGTELLVEGAVDVSSWIGGAVIVAAALNGIAILHGYLRVFTGKRSVAAIPLVARFAERIAVLALAGLILGGGLIPQPGVRSRHHAAVELIRSRVARLQSPTREFINPWSAQR